MANGFPLNSPYNADLPYNLTQKALFGEINYEVNKQLTATAGGRFYDYEEERTFKSGGLFSDGNNNFDKGAQAEAASQWRRDHVFPDVLDTVAQVLAKRPAPAA